MFAVKSPTTRTNIQAAPRVNCPPSGSNLQLLLTPEFMQFLEPLHREFTVRQRALATNRTKVLLASKRGDKPTHLPVSVATEGEWRIALPDWVKDQRNQMTGPADDAELVVKMLNSGAPGVMLDLEDSMANTWGHLVQGIDNIVAALHGTLTYYDKKRGRRIGIEPGRRVIYTRPRGLHLTQAGILPGELMSASLFDVAQVAFSVEPHKLQHPLTFYIPKSESALEARWWADLFRWVAEARGWPKDYIKCMALVEAHPMAFQMEEFVYYLRHHIVGLNLGRWDYMASLIHFNLTDPQWVLPDRNTIPHDVPFFQRLRELLVEICHKRGILAIGGMTALYPSRTDAVLNERALQVLAQDKKNEADCGMDGAWTGHPDQNAIAVAQFPAPNQLERRYPEGERYPDLRPLPQGLGARTLSGTRAAVRTVIRYRNGVLHGKGASLLDGYMEDLATDRIYRLMIAQRMRHYEYAPITDEKGQIVPHTPALITQIFDEELARILAELSPAELAENRATYNAARRISEDMITLGQFDPV
jgi:malate synthase